MKKTIKEDNQRTVIKQEYLNNNSLLEISIVDGKIEVTIRFIEGKSIKEHILTIMSVEDFLLEKDTYRISEDGKKMALFKTKNDEYYLERLYDLEEHEFTVCDFMDLEYRKHFTIPVLNEHLSYKKVKKDE